jgi:hypothetical protein
MGKARVWLKNNLSSVVGGLRLGSSISQTNLQLVHPI